MVAGLGAGERKSIAVASPGTVCEQVANVTNCVQLSHAAVSGKVDGKPAQQAVCGAIVDLSSQTERNVLVSRNVLWNFTLNVGKPG